jgi:hypothetical protein
MPEKRKRFVKMELTAEKGMDIADIIPFFQFNGIVLLVADNPAIQNKNNLIRPRPLDQTLDHGIVFFKVPNNLDHPSKLALKRYFMFVIVDLYFHKQPF